MRPTLNRRAPFKDGFRFSVINSATAWAHFFHQIGRTCGHGKARHRFSVHNFLFSAKRAPRRRKQTLGAFLKTVFGFRQLTTKESAAAFWGKLCFRPKMQTQLGR